MTRRSRRSALLSCLVVVASLAVPLSGPAHAAKAKTFKVSAAWVASEVYTGDKAVLKGSISPVLRKKKVLIQEKTEDGWTTVAKKSVSKKGTFGFAVTHDEVGDWTYRARMPRTGKVRAGTSKARTLSVTKNPVVTFTIPPGSAHVAWNSSDNPVVAEVGQTLHLINGDDEDHLLHSDSMGPFPHPDVSQPIPPGGSADYLITQAFASWLYCHAHADTNEKFWITVTDPSTS